MRIALGCMRLSVTAARDDARSRETIRGALDAGVTRFDTARAYDDNEHLLAEALRGAPDPRVITKCGMRRPGGGWEPDGRAASILADARASAAILPVDLLLLHAPDPRVSLATSVRALARAREEGLTRRIGVSNVSRAQLGEAMAIARLDAVEVALGAYDDASLRGSVVALAHEHAIEVLAHSPLGGPARAPRLARDHELVALARAHDASVAELFVAYLLAVHPAIVPVVGATRPETARRLAFMATLPLAEQTLLALDRRFPALGALRRPPPRPTLSTREVVMLMGLPGAAKSTLARTFEGYTRLNRDTLGGTLKRVVRALDQRLSEGDDRVVLDNTYVTRASRHDVIATAHRHGARVRCLFLDTPMHQAQINVVLRMLDKYGRLLSPEEIATTAKVDPNMVPPTALFRMARELEPPDPNEGFAAVGVVPFVRAPRPHWTKPATIVAFDALDDATDADLVFGWNVDDAARAHAAARFPAAELAVCAHPAGAPVCWCRPPLPGLIVAFLERAGVDPTKSTLVGKPAHEAMARALGMTFRSAGRSPAPTGA